MNINPKTDHPWYPQYPPHRQFPGLDIDKGPVYRAGAILLGAWLIVVVLSPLTALTLQETWPLWPVTRWLGWTLFALVLASALLFRFVWDRKRYGVRPRRFGIQRIEASREGTGVSKRSVIWDPYDRLPALFRRWYAMWLYDIGDGLIEMLLRAMGADRATMVEEPPYFDAPMWHQLPPRTGPQQVQGGGGPGALGGGAPPDGPAGPVPF